MVHRSVCRIVGERTFGAEKASRNIDFFATDNDNLLTIQQLLGDDTGKATVQMAFAVNNDLCLNGQTSIVMSHY